MKFPSIESENVILRELREKDSTILFGVYSNDKAMQYWDSSIHHTISVTIEMLQRMKNAWYKQKGISWGIIYKKTKNLIGQFSFHSWNIDLHEAKLGYIIDPIYWNKGIGSEVLKLVVNFGFNDLSLKCIIAEIDPKNIASSTILIKHGFSLIKSKKNDIFLNGVYYDTNVYKLSNCSIKS